MGGKALDILRELRLTGSTHTDVWQAYPTASLHALRSIQHGNTERSRHHLDIECVCGKWHNLGTAGLALVVRAYQEGELTTVSKGKVTAICMMTAFTEENLEEIDRRYPRRRVLYPSDVND